VFLILYNLRRATRLTITLLIVLFERGRNIAKELDEEFARTKKLKGPLHGVPISFKDMCLYSLSCVDLILILRILVDFEGVDSTIGFSQWAGQTATADADVSRHGLSSSSPFLLTQDCQK
jgi:amidase